MNTKSYNMLTVLKNLDHRQFLTLKHHFDSLISVTKAIGSIAILDELLEKTLNYAVVVTGAERGFLFLYSHDKEDLVLEAIEGVSEVIQNEGEFSFEEYRVSGDIIKVVKNTGMPLIGNQKDSCGAQAFGELRRYGVAQALCVPLQSKGETLGFIYLDHGFDRGLFREQELELMKSFAALISLRIENAFLESMVGKRKLDNISLAISDVPGMPYLKIVTLEGILNSITMKQVDKKIVPLIDDKTSDIIMDLRNIDYASKSGILCLIKYLARLTSMKRTLKFIRPLHPVYRAFEISGISKRLDMYDDIEAAVSTFRDISLNI